MRAPLFFSFVAALCLQGCNCGADQPRSTSSFDTGNDGWTIVGDAQSQAVTPTFENGFISAKDDVTGGTWYFQAPAKYLGDNTSVAGKRLRFDLKVTEITGPFGNYDVVLQGGGKTLAYNFPNDPTTAWTTYVAPLSAAGWKVVADPVISEITDSNFAALPDATAADFSAVLANTTLLRLRGEFNNGADTGSLDNVVWGAAN